MKKNIVKKNNVLVEKKEDIIDRWVKEIQENPHFSAEEFSQKEEVLAYSKDLYNTILSSLNFEPIPDFSVKKLEPLFKTWHKLLSSQRQKGLSTKDTAMLIFSLKSTLLSFFKEYYQSSDYEYNPDMARLNQLLDVLGLLTFEIYTAEKDKLIDIKDEQINYLQTLQVGDLYEKVIGKSPQMRDVFKAIGLVLENDITVLLEGETGTGKDLLAQLIHKNSNRKNKPFVTVNCGAIPKELIESELFGHERGAFTGAVEKRIGKFELAAEGTLFLDEIGDLELAMQVKLLRALQHKEVERIGGAEKIPINVRIIAATNKDLKKEVAKNNFRMDLYYRLHVFPIKIPPLRERKDDILPLAKYFLQKYSQKYNPKVKSLTSSAEAYLLQAEWEGNVRELENVMQRAVLLCPGETIEVNILTQKIGLFEPQEPRLLSSPHGDNEIQSLAEIEKNAIIEAIKIKKGNLRQAAQSLKISRTTLYNKAKKYHIKINQAA
jgi:transcriptional regulator with GAF, ATPase, and Fis domain